MYSVVTIIRLSEEVLYLDFFASFFLSHLLVIETQYATPTI